MRRPVVALDESGNTGQNLFDPSQPVFCLASTCFTQSQASELVEIVKSNQNAEPCFANLKKTKTGQRKIKELIRSSLLSKQTVKTAVFDKRYFAMCKMLDMLVEPLFHGIGVDFYQRGMNLAMANPTTYPCGMRLYPRGFPHSICRR